ncbi:ribulose-phosphate 3-epimerase [Phyllobacterium sp. SB3]|uniref:ribulose-phosphate 3-epimerase n=1 Tax=Phyllobacterium sp. SB3 TaxID=3156073 RepID=UPI0032AF1F71
MPPRQDWPETLPFDRLLAEFSLWSADLGQLAGEIDRVDSAVDIYHIDVADGHFSPAMLFFPDLVSVCRKRTVKPLHVHLMVSDSILPDQIRQFADSGADLISVHAENSNLESVLQLIENLGLKAGLVLQLQTSVSAFVPCINQISMVTLLGTRIGVKGQSLDSQAGARLQAAKQLIANQNPPHRVLLAADGGIREETVPDLRKAGADTVVMGSLAFNSDDLEARIAWVHAQQGKS